MNIQNFLSELKILSQTNGKIKLYSYDNKEKLFSRFFNRVYTLDVNLKNILTDGWLSELYKETNGIDFGNYYIIPFNDYFNKKPFSFDKMMYEWILNPNGGNDYSDNFYPFLTNGKKIIGLLGNLKNNTGDNFIGILRIQNKHVIDVIIIASSIYILLDSIIKQLKEAGELHIGENTNIWIKDDKELYEYYNNGKIEEYKNGGYLLELNKTVF
ncbi:MAG: hypothetical protein LBL72_06190 [Candidatus Accumulibacter sp.]|jgi:hypothetical protein|nr:hypothetical protein [Accumulibacter sp.]